MKAKFYSSGFTVIELLIVLTIASLLASLALGSFEGYMLRSKTAEAPLGVGKIVDGEIQYYHSNTALLAAGPSNIPPAPRGPTLVDLTTDPRWKQLNFAMDSRLYFGYQADLVSATQVNCEAMADLTGDGISSLFRRTVTTNGNNITAGGLYIFDELE